MISAITSLADAARTQLRLRGWLRLRTSAYASAAESLAASSSSRTAWVDPSRLHSSLISRSNQDGAKSFRVTEFFGLVFQILCHAALQPRARQANSSADDADERRSERNAPLPPTKDHPSSAPIRAICGQKRSTEGNRGSRASHQYPFSNQALLPLLPPVQNSAKTKHAIQTTNNFHRLSPSSASIRAICGQRHRLLVSPPTPAPKNRGPLRRGHENPTRNNDLRQQGEQLLVFLINLKMRNASRSLSAPAASTTKSQQP